MSKMCCSKTTLRKCREAAFGEKGTGEKYFSVKEKKAVFYGWSKRTDDKDTKIGRGVTSTGIEWRANSGPYIFEKVRSRCGRRLEMWNKA